MFGDHLEHTHILRGKGRGIGAYDRGNPIGYVFMIEYNNQVTGVREL